MVDEEPNVGLPFKERISSKTVSSYDEAKEAESWECRSKHVRPKNPDILTIRMHRNRTAISW